MAKKTMPADVSLRHGELISRSELVRLHEARLSPRGREVLNPRPFAPPVRHTPSMVDHMKTLIRSEQLAREAHAQGFESFDEADDFEVGDDYDPSSPYEEVFEGDMVEDFARRFVAANSPREPRQEAPARPTRRERQRSQEPLDGPQDDNGERRDGDARISPSQMESIVSGVVEALRARRPGRVVPRK